MKRFLPAPLLSVALCALWLLLNQSISPGHLIIGAAVGLLVPWMSASLRPQRGPVSRPLVLVRLVLTVGRGVVLSALDVARGVAASSGKPPRSGFVRVPLDLRSAHALAALAIITTVVPGTVWTELAADGRSLLLHVWDLEDEAEFIAHFKQDYERPLMEIFE
ncbi:MAG: Na+/H+ antiporter subunit E [Rubrivivax sp.]|nr:MAG: Na+/H+ antiporter subunit E [Rubrivivax sp.]